MWLKRTVAAAVFGIFAAQAMTGDAHAQTFRWAFQGENITMDPHSTTEFTTVGFLSNIYEGLVRRDREMQIEPALAAEWTLESPTVWRFKLRENVKFHDGSPFTADDVIFSYERSLKDGSDVKPRIQSIKEIRKIGDHEIEIETNAPNPILLSELADWFILSKVWSEANNADAPADVRKGGENAATHSANGTGPFKLTQRQRDERTVLTANADWWDEPEFNIQEAIFSPVSNNATRVAALLSGNVDMIYPVPSQDIPRLEQTPDFELLKGPESRVVFLGFDVARDELLHSSVKGANPFKDQRVRQAVHHAIDVEAIKSRIMRDASFPTGTLIAPSVTGYDESLNQRLPYDLEKAKALMAEAGYADGFSLTMDCPNDRYVNDEAICQAVAAMLARLNIKVDLQAQTRSLFFKKVLERDTSFYLHAWATSTNDGHNILYDLLNTPSPEKGTWNLNGYSNPKVDELTAQVAGEMDAEVRKKLLVEAFDLVRQDEAHVPLHQQMLVWAKRKNIDLHQRPDDRLELRYVNVN
ncbi:ABC transporter substrate-binding protein [Aureimonas fodinaquatilis]|uniref:ABC transporter substrate-binding protein n=2 Tax=Aureimonas fodinaquatilis TaxID=2565783 RepID=A0A5B0DUZ0_9HYPH|nr:ABC transporter substrate-binding protein [Aureimonas fodinaquatilis]